MYYFVSGPKILIFYQKLFLLMENRLNYIYRFVLYNYLQRNHHLRVLILILNHLQISNFFLHQIHYKIKNQYHLSREDINNQSQYNLDQIKNINNIQSFQKQSLMFFHLILIHQYLEQLKRLHSNFNRLYKQYKF